MTFSQVYGFVCSDRYGEFLRYEEDKARLGELRGGGFLDGDTLRRAGELSVKREERDSWRAVADSLEGERANLKARAEALSRELGDIDVLLEFYKAALEELSGGYLGELSSLMTDVYRAVYGTSSKSVLLSMEDYRGKKGIRLNIVNRCGGRQYKEPLSSDGGSAQIILGTMVALFYIVRAGLPRVVFFDESLSALADDTLRAFLSVLRDFACRLGFCLVVIEHAAFRLRGFVDRAYTVEDGVYSEVGLDFELGG